MVVPCQESEPIISFCIIIVCLIFSELFLDSISLGAQMDYDPQNIFAKIIRGEIPCNRIYEDSWVLAFSDIHPQAIFHVLIVTKSPYKDYFQFVSHASSEEVIALARGIHHIIAEHNLDKMGYRLITNSGSYGGQEVPHLHFHLCSGEYLGPLLCPEDLRQTKLESFKKP